MFNRVQAIIFGDPLASPTSSSSTSSTSTSHIPGAPTQRVGTEIGPAIVGLSVIAAAVAQPQLATTTGSVAVEQGRRRTEDGLGLEWESDSDFLSDEDDQDHSPETPKRPSSSRTRAKLTSTRPRQRREPSYLPGAPLAPPPEFTPSSSPPNRPRSAHSSSNQPTLPLPRQIQGRNVGHTQSSTQLPVPSSFPVTKSTPTSPTQSRSKSPVPKVAFQDVPERHSADSPPHGSAGSFGRRRPMVPSTIAVSPPQPHGSHSYSVPSLPSTAASTSLYPQPSHPKPILAALLRSHACRSQLDLLSSLQDISTRLIAVPKMARLSALRAELTVLNHGLPRGCCLGINCSGQGGLDDDDDDAAGDQPNLFSNPNGLHRPHHRIVRICPSEAVVLNSADRAPYLLQVEVLEGDLDFDPDRRQNAEDLRRALGLGEPDSLSRRGLIHRAASSNEMDRSDEILGASPAQLGDSEIRTFDQGEAFTPDGTPATPSPDRKIREASPAVVAPTTPDMPPSQEVDLVEQLYGNLSIHDQPPLSDGGFSPLIHNRSIDEETWNRAGEDTDGALGMGSPPGTSRPPSNQALRPQGIVRKPSANRKQMTLDEYAERMRMAAIMLSQLNASQQVGAASVSATVVGAGGGLVGVGMGIGAGIGGVVGAGLEAVKGRLPFVKRDNASGGQASAGVTTRVDTASAASGLSAVSGSPSIDSTPPSLSSLAAAATVPSSSTTSSGSPAPQNQRQRVLPPAEAAAIRERIMSEMMALEEERMERMKTDSRRWASGGNEAQDEGVVRRAVSKDDPSAAVFHESWAEKRGRIRKASPYGHLASWELLSVIIKTGADLRQEQLAIQLIKEFGRIWTEGGCPHWVR
jgi:hypothetical protein